MTVDLTAARVKSAGQLTSLSVSGGAIELVADLALHARAEITIEAPYRLLPQWPVVRACVVRKYPRGIAVEWCTYAPPCIVELLRAGVGADAPLLSRWAADPFG
ncbi:MAG TPA: hypothetical protein VME42_06255 [Steroidobacteraceae bacterium]|nr:hypothetical protein [Steroidobacteraceae bacterium]